MSSLSSAGGSSFKPVSGPLRSRARFALFWTVCLTLGWLVLRLVLLLAFGRDSGNALEIGKALGAGLYRDIYVAFLFALPIWLWAAARLKPTGKSPAPWRVFLFWFGCGLTWFLLIFLLFVEFFFFEEFKSRFNTVAVDYLLYPHEVFVNIWESYHVGWFLTFCAVLAGVWVVTARKLFPQLSPADKPRGVRWRPVLGICLLLLAMTPFIHLKPPRIGNNRTLNEIANNGSLSFVAAAWTHHLDYGAFYKTIPRDEAYSRARRILAQPNADLAAEPLSIVRKINGDPSRPKLNVIILLEESLGSEFWGCLGRKEPTLTPEMDKLATDEGLLFTNLYASGNRTVRGMEGVLSSFPPLPGDSIVKRDKSDNVETLARVLKRDGYQTLFLYGGRGFFDGMRSFTVRNGYDRFIEQKHFAHPTFTTIWGVCDEDLYTRTIEECRLMHQSGEPFFATALTVSNHKPYTYPAGRIAEKPDGGRDHVVKYTDFALGQFFRMAKKEAFWTNTIFVVVADHGARVYGEQSIPIHSYEIPLVILGPAAVSKPARLGQLGGSLDVGPTILGIIGRPYQSIFFGRDLLNAPSATEGRALLNHNRDIGMLAHDRMIVLGLMQAEEFYEGNPKLVQSHLMKQTGPAERELQADTCALFQIADELYTTQRYRLDSVVPQK